MCCDHNVGLKYFARLAKCKSQCSGLLVGYDFRTGKKVPPKKSVQKQNIKPSTKTGTTSKPTKSGNTQAKTNPTTSNKQNKQNKPTTTVSQPKPKKA